jgi:transcriptional regulator with PAS, ATPase and Fis domain
MRRTPLELIVAPVLKRMAQRLADALRGAVARGFGGGRHAAAQKRHRRAPKVTSLQTALRSYEREIIARALVEHGSFRTAAKALGIPGTTLKYKARKYGLASPSTRGRRS